MSQPSSGHEPATVAMLSVANVRGFDPDGYIGMVLATGSSAAEAYAALGDRARQLARESHARQARRQDHAVPHWYAVLGLRLTSGITASGQPEWLAYGTLARGTRSLLHNTPDDED